ncbi:MAG TPA: glycosyl hydrolase 115 family protein [Acidobacteriaceae bacterium]|nr:glycosyl hydrolase 115 family protein [Acidobacteriaceae bacterium]
MSSTKGANGASGYFVLCGGGQIPPLYVASQDSPTVRLVADAFAGDVERVTGKRPKILTGTEAPAAKYLIIIGTIGQSPLLDKLRANRKLDTSAVEGKWEAAVTTVVHHPFPRVDSALVIAGSDRRGTAYAVFDLSRRIGVSPWNWWADVPIRHHAFLAVNLDRYVQGPPSVKYRGIFLNDEDWGLRPWAAQKMDPELQNIGPHTYARVFELLLRLHANTLWPAMHPRTLPFNAVPENANLADKWGIVMGSSHSEALLRNNVGEWNYKLNGPWNYQLNRAAIMRYWDERLKSNGKFENIYTVGMRGVHDGPLEATGSPEDKARLVGKVIADQEQLLAARVNPDVTQIPQVIWLYKEVLGLYRVGMKIPDDVTLGWSDDNYGYIRELPNEQEQERPGGSALYYHVSYFGEPHDYLWLCSTPPAQIREELTKAWDHGVRKMWILNVGDLKPAEMDIDYFLRMAWNEPTTARLSQHDFLMAWNREQFPDAYASSIADLMDTYFQLNFIRKPEFMGFNGNGKPIERTAFNPLSWGDQNRKRLLDWGTLSTRAAALGLRLPPEYRDAYFELTGYPIAAAAAQNAKFLWDDRSYLDADEGHDRFEQSDTRHVKGAYDRIQSLTQRYNQLAGGKWDGIMSSAPRHLAVFGLPATVETGADPPALPSTWGVSKSDNATPKFGARFAERDRTVSIDAVHFESERNSNQGMWQRRTDLGLPGGSVFFGEPGRVAAADWVNAGKPDSKRALSTAPWIEYKFTTADDGDALLSLYLLPTFPVDSERRLTYAVIVDGGAPVVLDASGAEDHRDGLTPWASNVLRNAAIQTVGIGNLRAGRHTLRLVYGDPGVVFQHVLITFGGAAPAYPFPPETGRWLQR